MTALRLVLVRHGQTPSNVVNSLDSRPPGPPLTDLGRQQAAAVADALAALPVVAVYASVAVRAQQTAAPIAAAHGLDVQVVEGVHEAFVGDLECRNDPDAMAAFFAVFHRWTRSAELDVPMPGGESAQQVLDRFLPVVAGIRSRHEDGVVVLVSHGAAIRISSFALSPNVDAELADQHLLHNGGRVVLEADDSSPTGWRCLEWAGATVN
ncbi:histidine phosphatase family protein [Kutzneria kofuensis]|uniref:Putative phosphoglycerate mutase n=1 Tax=Kutzneria kofuensis TaxID=103725 RepID=A0A7W9KH38_9PSEU|nr:histidine phosphatase family protein [Kutzneria kofuensis]MBB5892486.1 putative phosphoglycerate mutase [Kutzneria kofuensis]